MDVELSGKSESKIKSRLNDSWKNIVVCGYSRIAGKVFCEWSNGFGFWEV